MDEHYLRAELAVGELAGPGDARALLRWAGAVADNAAAEDIYRSKEGRKTLRFERNGRPYFLKLHRGIGWGEIFKNLFKLRLPVLGASNEYQAVNELRRQGVDTMSVAAYASVGFDPAAIQSLIVTDELVDTISLEDYCADWQRNPPDPAIRMCLLVKLADSSRRMHGAGINHRDFYICHFHLDEKSLGEPVVRCHIIDLHRAQMRRQVPRRWQVKDLAGLYFSAMDCGLRRRDLLRFIHHYTDGGLRKALGRDAGLWLQVARRAEQLYRREHGREPPEDNGRLTDGT